MSAIKGRPVWLELYTTDLERAKQFYGELLGWSFINPGDEFGGYHMVMLGDEVVGGAMQAIPGEGEADSFAIYLDTDDVAGVTEAVRERGGQVLVEPMAIEGMGTMAFYIGPDGAAIGAWDGARTEGQARNKPGAPSWFELMTLRYDDSVDFYREVFGFDIVPMPADDDDNGMRYATNGAGNEAVAGICDAVAWFPSDAQSFWRPYLDVTDTDAAVAKLTELGGKLVDGPIDSPFGRVATVADDQGTTFQILGPVAAA